MIKREEIKKYYRCEYCNVEYTSEIQARLCEYNCIGDKKYENELTSLGLYERNDFMHDGFSEWKGDNISIIIDDCGEVSIVHCLYDIDLVIKITKAICAFKNALFVNLD